MARIRRITLGQGAAATTAFHGFIVNENGDLVYTKGTSGDIDVQDQDQIVQYVMYEVGVAGSTYIIDDTGDLVIEYDSAE